MADTLVWDVGHWDVDIWGWDAPPPPEPPTPTTYTVDLCHGFDRVGTATAFELSAVIRNLAVGEWQLSAPLVGLECPDPGAVDSIIVYDDQTVARIVFAGIVRRVGGVDGGVTRQVTAQGTHIQFRGVDVFGLLATRHAWPTPSTMPPWADSHDTRTGAGSTVAAGYITANLGAGAIAARQIPGVTVIDPVVGATATWDGRLQPLDQLVARICRESGITCRGTMTAPGVFQFTFGSPRDLSNTILLTDQGDLEELSRLVSPATGTFVLAAGQGDLTARAFATADSGATGLDRVEAVYENTNITTGSGLVTAAASQLALNGQDVSVDGVIAAAAAQRIRFLDDYRIGDWLGVEVDSVRYASQVEGVVISLTAARESVRPVLGRASTNEAISIIRSVAGLEQRFDSQIH